MIWAARKSLCRYRSVVYAAVYNIVVAYAVWDVCISIL